MRYFKGKQFKKDIILVAVGGSVAKIIKYKKSMTYSVRNPLLCSETEEVIDELYLISDRLFKEK
ncbi:hypothetical protein BK708_15000 [Bacillus thuringiensis serovar yunnanensis]|nr:hypothetical protein BK708_15000 [Bacillus thuringiensis serovar yunnanensis]